MKFESYDQMLARQERQSRRDFWIGMTILCLGLLGCVSLILLPVLLQPKPKLPRATPLITATDLAPEDR